MPLAIYIISKQLLNANTVIVMLLLPEMNLLHSVPGVIRPSKLWKIKRDLSLT
jgi:hypothetical protein